MAAPRYDLRRDLSGGQNPASPDDLTDSAHWALAVVRLGEPVSYSRKRKKSRKLAVEGGFLRNQEPLIIREDCIQLQVQNSKRSHVKTLHAVMKPGRHNYLDADKIVPGDWILAWVTHSGEALDDVLNRVKKGQQANRGSDGLKFVGRIHSQRKQVSTDPGGGRKTVHYSIQALGFDEFDNQFFYNPALASQASQSAAEIRLFLAELGLDYAQLAEKEQLAAGNVEDNVDKLVSALINIILGRGADERVLLPLERAAQAAAAVNPEVAEEYAFKDLKVAVQTTREAPYAYLVPRTLGTLLGKIPSDASKGQMIFGYSDILETLIGVQRYTPTSRASVGLEEMYPDIDFARSTRSRIYTPTQVKGTFVPVNVRFINTPLWSLLQSYLNPTINEIYTALKLNHEGDVIPTLVVRQFPFTTESHTDAPKFPTTRFMNLPRWVLPTTLVRNLDIGRSNATRVNYVQVFGAATGMQSNRDATNQIVRNQPVYDQVDIQRSGMRARILSVQCAVADQTRRDGARTWIEAIADWTIGSHLTLNGTVECCGLQSPVAEGDNLELDDVVYHIESVSHACGVDPGGRRTWRTHLELSNGMPVDQGGATADFPVYSGFSQAPVVPPPINDDPLAGLNAGDLNDLAEAGTGGQLPQVDVETAVFGDDDAVTGFDPEHGAD